MNMNLNYLLGKNANS